MKKIFQVWITVEPNNTEIIKNIIDGLLNGNIMPTLEKCESCIYKEEGRRLFKQDTNEEGTRLAKLKLPRLIELASNAPKHILEQVLANVKNKQQDVNQFETTKEYGLKKIIAYVGIKEM